MSIERTRSQAVVSALLGAGLIEPARQDQARTVVEGALGAGHRSNTPLRRRMAEIAGYVGGAFVVAAAGLFFAGQWGNLGHGGRIGLLTGIALLLGAATAALVTTGAVDHVRRRLASVLATGAALSAGFAAGLAAQDPNTFRDDSRGWLVGAVVVVLVALLGYRVAPSAVGQLAIAGGAFAIVPSGLDLLGGADAVPFGLLVLGIGAVWLLLAETGRWREDDSARVIGSVLVVVGAQIPIFGDHPWVAYVVTALAGALAFAGFMARPAWAYLATGVIALTLAVPEALTDWAQGSLGSAGVLLATGVTLLAASVGGLRLRRETTS
jgi:hypothetical protein